MNCVNCLISLIIYIDNIQAVLDIFVIHETWDNVCLDGTHDHVHNILYITIHGLAAPLTICVNHVVTNQIL